MSVSFCAAPSASASTDAVVRAAGPGIRGAGHEGEAVDQLAAAREGVAAAQAVDDGLRTELVAAVAHHHELALVLAGVEVLRRTAIVRAEHAAVVPVGTREEPVVAALAEHRIPDAADLRSVHAGAAIGRAADRVDEHAADVVAADLILAAVRRGAMARLALHAERRVGRGVVEVAQVLDVEALVAIGIERAGTFQVGRHVVARAVVEGGHPLHGFDGLLVTLRAVAGAARRDQLLRGRVPARVGGVRAARNRAVPVVAHGRTGCCVAAAGVGIGAVEAVFPLGQRRGVAERVVALGRRQRHGVDRRRHLAGDHRHRRVLVSGHHRLHADEERLALGGRQVLDQRILDLLDRLPAPHVAPRAAAAHVALDGHAGIDPARVRTDGRVVRISRRGKALVFDERAVAVAVAAVAGLHEPVEAPGRVDLVGGLLHQLLHRDRAVRAGRVVVEIAGDVLAGRLACGDDACRRGRQNGGADGSDRRQGDLMLGETEIHERCSSLDSVVGSIRHGGASASRRPGRAPSAARSSAPERN